MEQFIWLSSNSHKTSLLGLFIDLGVKATLNPPRATWADFR